MLRVLFALDHDMDGKLGLEDLRQPAARAFVAHTKLDIISARIAPLAPGCLLKLADFPDGLSLETLLIALLDAWGATGGQWRALFVAMGYDGTSLRPRGAAIPFVLAVHASQPMALRRHALPASVYDSTLCLYCKMQGSPAHLGDATVYALPTGMGAIFVAENRSTRAPCQIQVDCTESINVVGDCGALQAGCALPEAPMGVSAITPHFVLAIAQKSPDEAYSWTFTCNAGGLRTTPRPPVLFGLGPMYDKVLLRKPLDTVNATRADQVSSVHWPSSGTNDLMPEDEEPPLSSIPAWLQPSKAELKPWRLLGMPEEEGSVRSAAATTSPSEGGLLLPPLAIMGVAREGARGEGERRGERRGEHREDTAAYAPVAALDISPLLAPVAFPAQHLFQQHFEPYVHVNLEPYVAPGKATREDVQRYIRTLEVRERVLERHRARQKAAEEAKKTFGGLSSTVSKSSVGGGAEGDKCVLQ